MIESNIVYAGDTYTIFISTDTGVSITQPIDPVNGGTITSLQRAEEIRDEMIGIIETSISEPPPAEPQPQPPTIDERLRAVEDALLAIL